MILGLTVCAAMAGWASPAFASGPRPDAARLAEDAQSWALELGTAVEMPVLPEGMMSAPTVAAQAAPDSGWESPDDPSEVNSLYARGGLAALVWGPKEQSSRRISLKLRTVAASDYVLPVEEIAACDITHPSAVFCRQVSYRGGEKDIAFSFNDKEGHKRYVLRVSYTATDAWVTLGRPGHEDQMKTSIRNLFRARARQALEEGRRVNINGRDFLVLRQAGIRGAVLFFRGGLEDRTDSSDLSEMSPFLMAEVTRYVPGVGNVRIGDRVSLGTIGDRRYDLVYDENRRDWVPIEAGY